MCILSLFMTFFFFCSIQVGVVHISDGSKLYLLPTSPLSESLG